MSYQTRLMDFKQISRSAKKKRTSRCALLVRNGSAAFGPCRIAMGRHGTLFGLADFDPTRCCRVTFTSGAMLRLGSRLGLFGSGLGLGLVVAAAGEEEQSRAEQQQQSGKLLH